MNKNSNKKIKTNELGTKLRNKLGSELRKINISARLSIFIKAETEICDIIEYQIWYEIKDEIILYIKQNEKFSIRKT